MERPDLRRLAVRDIAAMSASGEGQYVWDQCTEVWTTPAKVQSLFEMTNDFMCASTHTFLRCVGFRKKQIKARRSNRCYAALDFPSGVTGCRSRRVVLSFGRLFDRRQSRSTIAYQAVSRFRSWWTIACLKMPSNANPSLRRLARGRVRTVARPFVTQYFRFSKT